MQDMPIPGGFIFLLFWLLPTLAVAIGYILMLVMFWRAMKAHEAIAETLRHIARQMERPAPSRKDTDQFTLGD